MTISAALLGGQQRMMEKGKKQKQTQCGEFPSWSQLHGKAHQLCGTSLDVPHGSVVGTAHQGEEGRCPGLPASSHHLQVCPECDNYSTLLGCARKAGLHHFWKLGEEPVSGSL